MISDWRTTSRRYPRAVDCALALATFTMGVIGITVPPEGPATPNVPDTFVVVISAVGAASLFLHRDRPRLTTGLTTMCALVLALTGVQLTPPAPGAVSGVTLSPRAPHRSAHGPYRSSRGHHDPARGFAGPRPGSPLGGVFHLRP